MTDYQSIKNKYETLGDWTILTGYRGSIAHGTYLDPEDPDSVDDKDTMSIVVPSQDYYYGLKEFGSRGTQEIKDGDWDIVVYELRKVIGLLAKGNPNILSILWLDDYIDKTDAGQLLLDNRDLFLSTCPYQSFIGYANGQLKKMKNLAFNGFMGEKRKALVQKHGYDTKNASHAIRIMRMSIEWLKEGTLHVKRDDAEELVAIKRGEWTLEAVKDEANKLLKQAEGAYEQSSLPSEPDYEKINSLTVEVVATALQGRPG